MFNALLGRWLGIGEWKPDLLLIALVYLGMTSGATPAILVGFIVGLYQDLYAAELLGRHALAKVWVGFLVGSVAGKIQIEQAYIQASMLFSACLLHEIILLVAMGGGVTGVFKAIWLRAVPTALYTTLAGMILSVILRDWLLPKGWGRREPSRPRRVR